MSRRTLRGAIAGIATATLLLSPTADAEQPRASLPDIEDEVMCPICGTTLELSDSPQANRERELIRRLIAEGRSKEEIKDALVAEYGPDVLALPEGDGFDASAWLVPGIGFSLAIAGVAIGFIRVRHRGSQPYDRAAELSQEERKRLEADLSMFDR
jgi:cytochrome c-type biogenesis protein CcmH